MELDELLRLLLQMIEMGPFWQLLTHGNLLLHAHGPQMGSAKGS
jgi:hypothetical protein